MPPFIRPSPDETRAFFALSVDETTLGELGRLRDRLLRKFPHRDNARAVADGSLHLTLKFLGNVPKAAVPELSRAMLAAMPRTPLETELVRLLAFGTPRHARVVAVELSERTGELARTVELLETAAATFGIARETRAFVPHLTLLRLHTPEDVRSFLEKMPFLPHPIAFDTLRLYESELLPTGSRYRTLSELALPALNRR